MSITYRNYYSVLHVEAIYYRISECINAVFSSALQQVGGSEWSVSLDTKHPISLLLLQAEMSVCLYGLVSSSALQQVGGRHFKVSGL